MIIKAFGRKNMAKMFSATKYYYYGFIYYYVDKAGFVAGNGRGANLENL